MRVNNLSKVSLLILSLLIFNSQLLIGTVRFVSTTGSSTPPYTTWETAADSIQECINYSVSGDTIYIANGTYYESLVVDKYLWLVGSSMDSTVIDGTDLANTTVNFQTDGYISYFTIKGKGEGTTNTRCIRANLSNAIITYCRLNNAFRGIALLWSSSVINKSIITKVEEGYLTGCDIDTCNPIVNNSVIVLDNSEEAGIIMEAGDNTASNNIVFGNQNSDRGIRTGVFFDPSSNIIINSIVTGFNKNIDGYAVDTAIVHNNISSYANDRGFAINSKTDMRNNIAAYNEVGVEGPTGTNSDYNLYWSNSTNTTDGLAEHDIVADPMFVNDTIPVYVGSLPTGQTGYDYHLQAFSPAIDAGDPNILDVDGSRSDIGAYGGPEGEKYIYLDLAPRPPINLMAENDSLEITLSWNKNTEADLSYYRIYRDTVPGFTIDSTKLISSQSDTFYVQFIPIGVTRIVYKLTAVDSQGHVSNPSEELIVNITSTGEYPVIISDYHLYQNYPNPFNPSTKIGYRLKESGYVKLMVYDIKGELIDVLVNKEQEAGYYETEFGRGLIHQTQQKHLSSGIYIYRIEIIGEGNIPVYSDMKKMILVK